MKKQFELLWQKLLIIVFCPFVFLSGLISLIILLDEWNDKVWDRWNDEIWGDMK